MLPGYAKNTNIGIGGGLVLNLIGRTMATQGMFAGYLFLLAGLPLYLWGCTQYAKGKGYSPWLGLLGLLTIIGLIALALFPDKHKKSPVVA